MLGPMTKEVAVLVTGVDMILDCCLRARCEHIHVRSTPASMLTKALRQKSKLMFLKLTGQQCSYIINSVGINNKPWANSVENARLPAL